MKKLVTFLKMLKRQVLRFQTPKRRLIFQGCPMCVSNTTYIQYLDKNGLIVFLLFRAIKDF